MDVGSPPRVRSRPYVINSICRNVGITSACAEQTVVSSEVLRPDWDHLRVCGADARLKASQALMQGSSPRVRSRHHAEVHVHDRLGIISACAEQTPHASSSSRSPRDHLRVCGADSGVKCDGCGIQGSSPRVRSRQPERPITQIPVGIISACAEQTTASNNTRITHRDHLRVCGADQTTNRAWGAGTGSSPRVRSRRLVFPGCELVARIISACAEQTGNPTTGGSPEGDHLRVCGADIASLDERARRRGSSPRVRSRPRAAGTPTRRSGIISACAEQTRPRGSSWRPRRDHLRVCGADYPMILLDGLIYGSSPRVRSRQ